MESNADEFKMLSISSVAKILAIGRDTVKQYISQGKLGFIKSGKRLKIPYSELQRFQATSVERTDPFPQNIKENLSSSKHIKSFFRKGLSTPKEPFNPQIILSKIMKE